MSAEMDIAVSVWDIVKETFTAEDYKELSHSLVGMLLDYGFELDDIRHGFKADKMVQKAIKFYADDEEEDDDHDDDTFTGNDDNIEW